MLQDIGNQSSMLFFSIIKSFINIEIYCDTCIDSSDAFKSITHTTICYDYIIFNVWTIKPIAWVDAICFSICKPL